MSQKTVLLVEDDPDVRGMLKTFLGREGYKVVEAEDGRAGVEAALRVRPDLILMDLQMPQLDGIAAIRLIRGYEELGRIPVVAMSAYGEKGMELFLGIDELGEGRTEYVTKPIRMDELKDLLEHILR